MTEYRDVYLLKKVDSDANTGNPFDKKADYQVASKAVFCRVNNLGLQKQALLFGGDSIYQDAKTVLVNGHCQADKLAFVDEYDPVTKKGIVYDISMPRRHANSTAFFIFNSKSKVG
ncbi:MAG: hypothetical protein LKJ72_01165 [[Lactobacillus] timonensis]|uniref:hypothetical protein n=1 Tax=[Lactobacillus] timonensis TaxID=1970790 RepID=UPI002353A47F|nr:hypothetical protein [[Lactobacillus] timonensis]MCI1925617.1 hypothetical protein [[Lactobacillus] timonensis]MCI1956976.1 hypothetical protein [[Lactobacillus] timonensis]MCI1970068.1 hypothetical protein [[Lactobacillus] timonensis]MCI2006167.1 hypothetical protein [[Lactobacillus] timonensis]